MKYVVTMEFNVVTVDLLPVTVEAASREDAIQLALKKYKDGEVNYADMYASEDYDESLSRNYQDWVVNEVE